MKNNQGKNVIHSTKVYLRHLTMVTRHLINVAAALLVLSTSGCAELDVHPGHRLEPSSSKGILAVGITASDNMPEFFWHFRKVGTTDRRDLTFYTVQNPLTWSHPRGRLAVIELEQGEYEFFAWQVVFGFAPSKTFRIPFSIKAGQVTYLGRIHLAVNKEQMRYEFQTSDHFSEDFPIIQDKVAGLSENAIYRQQAEINECADANCQNTSFIGNNVVIPVIVGK